MFPIGIGTVFPAFSSPTTCLSKWSAFSASASSRRWFCGGAQSAPHLEIVLQALFRAARLPRRTAANRERRWSLSLGRRQFSPDKKQNDRADDRQDQSRRMKRGPWFRFGKQAANQSADDRTADAEKSRHYEIDVLHSRIMARAI